MGTQKTGHTKKLLKLLNADECCVECPPISEDEGNIIECRAGKLFAQAPDGGGEFTLFTENSGSVTFSGSGTEDDPLVANSPIPPIQNGIVSGGEVTWIEDYTYSVSPAVYYINGIQYNSPYTELTLDPADATLNRIDVFALTTSKTAVNITGTPSANPEQPSIDSGNQLITSFALVVAGTTEPVGLSQEYIYRENLGTPTEWAASATGGIVVNSVSNPYAGSVDIEGTAVAAGNAITLVRVAATTLAATKNVLVFYIRSKATWNNNRILTFQFKNGVTNVGVGVPFSNSNSFGFVSGTTGVYQRVVIPFSAFGLTPSDNIDRLTITASGNGGTLGFHIDDIDTQGANILSPVPSGETDNIGVFYVSKNYSGIGSAVVTGYTLANITSANVGYNTQMLAARMGNPNKAYPCPWSARNAAMMAITAGTITKATIIMNGGSYWSYGSTNSAQNGSLAGVSATATVPDIAFNSGTFDIQSLLKNNIDYYFPPKTGLFNICKSFAIYVGWQLDLTDTSFKSGIYGYGDFHTIYGTLEGLSTRFIDIDNANAEVYFEANNAVFQRACLYVQNYKTFNVRIKKWIGGLRDTVIYERGSNREGDGSPSNLVVNVDVALSGTSFYPYPIITTQSGDQALFEFAGTSGGLQSIRQKNKVYNIGSLHHISHGGSGKLMKGQGSDAAAGQNFNLQMNIGSYIQRTDPTMATFKGPLVTIWYDNGTGLRQNTSWVFNIKYAEVDCAFNSGENGFSANALSTNNVVIFNIDYIRKKVTNAGAVMNDSIFCLPLSNAAIVGEKPTYIFNIGRAIADASYVFGNSAARAGSGSTAGYTYNANTILKGNFKTTSANPPIYIQALGSPCILQDCVLISAGTYSVDGSAVGKQIFAKDVTSNVPVNGTNVTAIGSLVTEPLITNYL